MNSCEIPCKIDNQTLAIQSNLLFKQNSSVPSQLTFPTHLHLEDLHLYTNFQATGYLNLNKLYKNVRVLLVGDFLQQTALCDLLINLITAQLTPSNFPVLLESLKSLSKETFGALLSQSSHLFKVNPSKFLDLFESFLPQSIKGLVLPPYPEENTSVQQCETTSLEELNANLLSLEHLIVEPECEFTWKLVLNDSSFYKSESFLLRNQVFFLTAEKKIDQVDFFLNSEPPNDVILTKGLLISHWGSLNFFYLTGSKQFITGTCQNPSFLTLRILLKEEKSLLSLLKQSSEEALNGLSLSNISSNALSLIVSFLSRSTAPDKIIEVIADWHQLNPSSSLNQVLLAFNSTAHDPDFWRKAAKKHPALFSSPQFSQNFQILTETISIKAPEAETELNHSPFLSPKSHPFNADLSEISTPKSKPRNPETRLHSLSQNYIPGLIFSQSLEIKSVLLIKELKKKLLTRFRNTKKIASRINL